MKSKTKEVGNMKNKKIRLYAIGCIFACLGFFPTVNAMDLELESGPDIAAGEIVQDQLSSELEVGPDIVVDEIIQVAAPLENQMPQLQPPQSRALMPAAPVPIRRAEDCCCNLDMNTSFCDDRTLRCCVPVTLVVVYWTVFLMANYL